MKFKELDIAGVWLIEPQRFGDARGYFEEAFRKDEFEAHVGHVEFLQDNESLSGHGVLRGLHFQSHAAAQAKLVRVSQGAVLDVAVDLRAGSPTFGQHVAVELSAGNGLQLFLPRGMAHGFFVTGEIAQFQYKVDNPYRPDTEATLSWNDPDLGIDWPLGGIEPLLSPKDLRGMPLSMIEPQKA